MTPENFVYWLQGFFELTEIKSLGDNVLSPKQVMIIKDHLALVFDKQTPDRDESTILPPDLEMSDELSEVIMKLMLNDAYGPLTPNYSTIVPLDKIVC